MHLWTLLVVAAAVAGRPATASSAVITIVLDDATLEEEIAEIHDRDMTGLDYLMIARRDAFSHAAFTDLLTRLGPIPTCIRLATADLSAAAELGYSPVTTSTTPVPPDEDISVHVKFAEKPIVYVFHSAPLDVTNSPILMDAASRIALLIGLLEDPPLDADLHVRLNKKLFVAVRGVEAAFGGEWDNEDQRSWYRILRQTHLRILLVAPTDWTQDFTRFALFVVKRLVAAATPPPTPPPGCFRACLRAVSGRSSRMTPAFRPKVLEILQPRIDLIRSRAEIVAGATSRSQFNEELNLMQRIVLNRCSGVLAIPSVAAAAGEQVLALLRLVEKPVVMEDWPGVMVELQKMSNDLSQALWAAM